MMEQVWLPKLIKRLVELHIEGSGNSSKGVGEDFFFFLKEIGTLLGGNKNRHRKGT